MALRASATARPPSVPPSLSPRKLYSHSKFTPSSSSAVSHSAKTTLPLFVLFTVPHEAKALTISKEQIVSSLDQAESTINQVQQVGSNIFDVTGQVIRGVLEAVKPGVDVALPILKQAGEETVKIASPLVSEASKKAQETMQSSGIDTQPLMTAAKTVADAAQQTTKVIDQAKPIATSTVETISSTDPVVIVGAGGALFLSYLLLPSIFSSISFRFRGYKGDLTPAQTLDLMSTKNYVMIDIRPEKDKNKDGVPRLPWAAKNKMVAIPLEELPSKIKSLVRNVKKLEAELVALKISYLKRIGKGSNIVILDSYTDSAKIVARALTNLGFKNCWIVSDGFSGGKGWLQSRLGADSYNVSFAEIVSPSRIIPSAARRFSSSGSTKLLPGGSE